MNNACLFQITPETNCTWRGRQNAVMDAARDGLNEARLADDGAEQVARSVVDCSTTPRGRRSSSAFSVSDYVIAEPRSSSCDDDSLTENADDADPAQTRQCREAVDDVEATTTTTTPTSVPLLEQLVSSPCDTVTPIPASSAAATSSTPAAAGDTDSHRSLNKSFLQKLESFVSSVGQAAKAAPLTGWVRRPVFPSRSGASAANNIPVTDRRPGPAKISPYSVSACFPPPSAAAESNWPLDLSAKRMESSASVDSTRSSQGRRVDLVQHGSGQGGVDSFIDMSEDQQNSASSLACLERDFGEHSAILTRLGSSRDRQRQTTAALATRCAAASRRGRTAVMPGLTASAYTTAGARMCPPGSVATPQAELHPPRSFIGSGRHLPTGGRTGVVGGKLDARDPTMLAATTAATVLRCLQCGRTFYSLPELTLHMIQSAHYANLICAAAAYSVDDDEDCVVVDAYNSRHSSNVGVDHSMHRSGPPQLSRGKGLPEMADAHRGDHLRRSNGDMRRRDCLDAAVSPARSLDDESVSSAGLTETDSLRSPSSTGSPTSPSYENVGRGAGDDDLAIMSHLLRLQPLLSRAVLDNMQTGVAIPGHVHWTAVGLAAADERRRQLIRGRSSKTTVLEVDRSPATDSLPIDMRCQRADGSRYRDIQSRQMSCLTAAAAKVPPLAPRSSSTGYLQKLLDDVRGYHNSLSAGVKRSSSSKWYNGKHRTKKQRTCSISSSDCDQTRYDGPRLNRDRSAIVSAAVPTSGEVCLRKRDDGLHGRRDTVSSVKISPPVNHEQQSSRRQEAADCTRRSTSKDSAVQPLVVDGTTNSDADVPTAVGRDLRRSSVDKDQSEYAARFGKYYRLAQELSNKSD